MRLTKSDIKIEKNYIFPCVYTILRFLPYDKGIAVKNWRTAMRSANKIIRFSEPQRDPSWQHSWRE